MKQFSLGIQIVSILAIIVPASISLLHIKTARPEIRLFFLFLFVGFLTDTIMFYLVNIVHYDRMDDLNMIFNFYSLIEAMVFYWFILESMRSKLFGTIIKLLLVITPLFWLVFIQLYPDLFFAKEKTSQVFSPTYQIAAAFLSVFAMLEMVERDNDFLSSHYFWILLGIFFYCFCTFFIMGFVNTVFSKKVYFLNNIFNIITYIFYSIGLWKYHERKKSGVEYKTSS